MVYEPNQPSYRAELQKVLAAKPDVIVMGSYLADTTIILREWFQTGETTKFIIPAWAANPQLVQALGPEVTEGIIAVDSISNEGSEAFKAYDAAYQKAMGQSGLFQRVRCHDLGHGGGSGAGHGSGGAECGCGRHRSQAARGRRPRRQDGLHLCRGQGGAEGGQDRLSGRLVHPRLRPVWRRDPDFSVSFINKGKIDRKYVVKL